MSCKIFTAAARNYASKVFTLVESLDFEEPDEFYWFIPERISVSDVSIPAHLFRKIKIVTLNQLLPDIDDTWIFSHSIIEISTAIKASALKYLLSKNTKTVIYLDPDLYFYGSLDQVKEEFSSYSIGLTPHQTYPSKGHKEFVDIDVCSYRHGIFNLGFLYISNDEIGQKLADWWEDRLLKYCRQNYFWGLFTDQKFFDLVPAIFQKIKISKNIGLNCAPWNLYYRKLSSKNNQYFVNGQPLIFYHFTGLNSGAHELAVKYYSSNQKLTKYMIDNYIQNCSNYSIFDREYEHRAYDNGEIIQDIHRVVYRSREDLQNSFRNPFSNSFHSWCLDRLHIEYPEMSLDQIATRVGPHKLKFVRSDFISPLTHLFRLGRSKT